eukprot:1174632-Amorphochlora_amoeboformis.AAC.2
MRRDTRIQTGKQGRIRTRINDCTGIRTRINDSYELPAKKGAISASERWFGFSTSCVIVVYRMTAFGRRVDGQYGVPPPPPPPNAMPPLPSLNDD